MIEPPTTPDPEEIPRDSGSCPHAEEYGRAGEYGTSLIRCGRCGAPVAPADPDPRETCACQRVGSYAQSCLDLGSCFERRSL